MAEWTGLEPATSAVTVPRSNQTELPLQKNIEHMGDYRKNKLGWQGFLKNNEASAPTCYFSKLLYTCSVIFYGNL